MRISDWSSDVCSSDLWLTYATPESLALYMYREPRKAKQLHFGVIPKTVDEYYQFLGGYAGQPVEQKLGNPVFHIHGGNPPANVPPVSFALLLNLVAVAGTSDKAVLWGFVRSEEHTSELQSLMRISYAVFCLKKKKQITHN